MKLGAETNSNMLNLMVLFNFSASDRKYHFCGATWDQNLKGAQGDCVESDEDVPFFNSGPEKVFLECWSEIVKIFA